MLQRRRSSYGYISGLTGVDVFEKSEAEVIQIDLV
jgi:hypothetical protein